MSDTVKLIIEIPKKTVAHIRSDYGHGCKGLRDEDRDKIVDEIYHNILLDDVIAEIADYVGGYICTNSLELSDEILKKWGK